MNLNILSSSPSMFEELFAVDGSLLAATLLLEYLFILEGVQKRNKILIIISCYWREKCSKLALKLKNMVSLNKNNHAAV